jgi:hypothetical protein
MINVRKYRNAEGKSASFGVASHTLMYTAVSGCRNTQYQPVRCQELVQLHVYFDLQFRICIPVVPGV